MGKLCIYLLGIVLFFGSCEDKKKASETEIEIETQTEIDTSASLNNQINEVEKKVEPEYPEITNENVVSFLTEYGKNNPETKVLISSSFGDIEIELYKDTPLHRANMIYLVKQKYFDETFFHRVVPNFIIQAGNSDIVSTPTKRTTIYFLQKLFRGEFTNTEQFLGQKSTVKTLITEPRLTSFSSSSGQNLQQPI